MINIIFGMCGNGSRFKESHPDSPKYLIKYFDDTMIYHAVKTLQIPGNIVFIVRKDHITSNRKSYLESLCDQLIIVDGLTSGAADTVMRAKDYIDSDLPLLSVNCDQYLNWDKEQSFKFYNLVESNPETNYILTFSSSNPAYSYVKLNANRKVIEVKEKAVIGPEACAGMFYWAHARDFFIDATSMMSNDDKVNNEYYMSQVFNYTINRGLDVDTYFLPTGTLFPVGTPEELDYFIKNYENNIKRRIS